MTNPNDPVMVGHYVNGEWGGITKRELFAAMALQGSLANPETIVPTEMEVRDAVEVADALIAELNKEPAK